MDDVVLLFFIFSLLNWNKYFHTALDFISAMADFLGLFLCCCLLINQLKDWSFLLPLCYFTGVTHSKLETAFNVLTMLFLSSYSIINWTAQLMFCTLLFKVFGNFILLSHRSMTSQTNEYTITSTSSLSVLLLMLHESFNGLLLNASAALLG